MCIQLPVFLLTSLQVECIEGGHGCGEHALAHRMGVANMLAHRMGVVNMLAHRQGWCLGKWHVC